MLVVDDDDLAAATTIALLGRDPEITVVGRARDGLEAIALAGRFRPAVVLMDLEMPRLDGVGATRELAEAEHRARVVLLTGSDMPEEMAAGIAAGALEALRKPISSEELVGAVRRAAST